MRRRIFLIAFGIAALVVASFWVAYPHLLSPYEQGKAEAHRDLREGRLVIHSWPMKGGGYGSDIEPDARLKVASVSVGSGCVIDDEDELYHLIGYNEVMHAEIERRARQLPPAGK